MRLCDILVKIGLMMMILGVAGFGGAIDTDTSPVISIALVVSAGLILLWAKAEGAFLEESEDDDVEQLLKGER